MSLFQDIKKDQLQLLGFQSKRPPGRLLMSLYGAFIGKWLEYFPCDQLLVVRSDGAWTELGEKMGHLPCYYDS